MHSKWAGWLLLFLLAVPQQGVAADIGRLIYEKESMYNSIFVFEVGAHRVLRFGMNQRLFTESSYNPNDETEMPVPYTRYVPLGALYADKLERAAVVGLGGGRTAWYLSHYIPEMKVTGIELDPEVVKVAERFFGFQEKGNLDVAVRDGRIYMRRSDEAFDLIVVDAYRGAFVPFHLLTKEFFEILADRLAPGGVVVQNIAPSTMLFDHAMATISAVFENVDLYKAEPRTNIVAIAYRGPAKTQEELSQAAAALQAKYRFRYPLPELMQTRLDDVEWDAEKVLTDDFSPANYLKSIEVHNRKWEE